MRFLSSLLLLILALFSAGCASQVATKTNPIDGQVMVRVPGGEFTMGTNVEQAATLASKFGIQTSALNMEAPQSSLPLGEFWIDQMPVTNAEYKKFLDANADHPVPFVDDPLARSFNWDERARIFPASRGAYPVVLVSWYDAGAYCKWAGKRLPTEAEWEKAARGTDARLYPWGNAWDATKANTAESRIGDATPVGQFTTGSSPYGALDMVGNVWQWTSSLDKPYPYQPTDGREDLQAQGLRVVRGGAWLFGAAITRTSMRNAFEPNDVSLSIGFRCAQ